MKQTSRELIEHVTQSLLEWPAKNEDKWWQTAEACRKNFGATRSRIGRLRSAPVKRVKQYLRALQLRRFGQTATHKAVMQMASAHKRLMSACVHVRWWAQQIVAVTHNRTPGFMLRLWRTSKLEKKNEKIARDCREKIEYFLRSPYNRGVHTVVLVADMLWWWAKGRVDDYGRQVLSVNESGELPGAYTDSFRYRAMIVPAGGGAWAGSAGVKMCSVVGCREAAAKIVANGVEYLMPFCKEHYKMIWPKSSLVAWTSCVMCGWTGQCRLTTFDGMYDGPVPVCPNCESAYHGLGLYNCVQPPPPKVDVSKAIRDVEKAVRQLLRRRRAATESRSGSVAEGRAVHPPAPEEKRRS